jgi:hypothetical protein
MTKTRWAVYLGGIVLLLGSLLLLGNRWHTAPDLPPSAVVVPVELATEEPPVTEPDSIDVPLVPGEAIYPTPTPRKPTVAVPPTNTGIPSVAAATSTSEPTTPDSTRTPVVVTPAAGAVPDHEYQVVMPAAERFRLGLALAYAPEFTYDLEALGVGWVMNWDVRLSTPWDDVVEYAQTVSFRGGVLTPRAGVLSSVASARPGSMWLISNEPDVRWQNDVPPEIYARLYHEAYTAIKAGDSTAVVAAGGIAQATDLRLRYLDLVLESYRDAYGEPLPADAWHIHNYMLREERDSWGVDIPAGLPDDTGALYAIEDSGNLELFKAQIYLFRRWLLDRGYAGQPLFVTEFGIPMPADYGFPPEVVIDFLKDTWTFFLTASDPVLGDPTDGGRLVQKWCWFGVSFADYPTGNLMDSATGEWTPVGRAWMSMVEQ